MGSHSRVLVADSDDPLDPRSTVHEPYCDKGPAAPSPKQSSDQFRYTTGVMSPTAVLVPVKQACDGDDHGKPVGVQVFLCTHLDTAMG